MHERIVKQLGAGSLGRTAIDPQHGDNKRVKGVLPHLKESLEAIDHFTL
jgi:hypothetical protein